MVMDITHYDPCLDIMGGGDPAMENQELEKVIFPAL